MKGPHRFRLYFCSLMMLLSFGVCGCTKGTDQTAVNDDMIHKKEAERTKDGSVTGSADSTNDNTQSMKQDNLNDTKEEVGKKQTGENESQEEKKVNYEEVFAKLTIPKGYKRQYEGNPLITQRFTADPYAIEYQDRVYVYTTNDSYDMGPGGKPKVNNYGQIRTLNCLSSSDMVNWTDHGTIKVGGRGAVCAWASNSWAPAVAYKKIDGKDKFFLYFANSGSSIGVLTADSPTGPWRDELGKALITKSIENCSGVVWCFDPAVLVDDDQKGYLYFGGGVPEGQSEMPNTARAVALGDDMISLAGVPVTIEAPYVFEDSGINKIGDTYYYSYCTNWDDSSITSKYHLEKAVIDYMTSKSPLGPWELKEPILDNPGKFFGQYGNNHHCMLQFRNQWYMFYHTLVLDQRVHGANKGYRCTHVNKVEIMEDGTIAPITADRKGVEQLECVNPYEPHDAASFARMADMDTIELEEPGLYLGNHMAALSKQPGGWIEIEGVDFGQKAAAECIVSVKAKNPGHLIKLCLDTPENDAIGYIEVPQNEDFCTVTVQLKEVEGIHSLCLVFSDEFITLDSWTFTR